MFHLRQVVETLHNGHWVQGTIVSVPSPRVDTYNIYTGSATPLARHDDDIRGTSPYYVVDRRSDPESPLRSSVLECFYSHDDKSALKRARESWTGHAANLWRGQPEDMSFIAGIDKNSRR